MRVNDLSQFKDFCNSPKILFSKTYHRGQNLEPRNIFSSLLKGKIEVNKLGLSCAKLKLTQKLQLKFELNLELKLKLVTTSPGGWLVVGWTGFSDNYTGEQNKKKNAVWNISPDSTLLGVTDT